MHRLFAQHLVDQHRAALVADAERHRLTRASRRPLADPLAVGPHELIVRPIAMSDRDRLLHLFGRLSRRTVHFRFFAPIHRLSAKELTRMVDVDHHHREALVALDGDDIVAVACYEGRPQAAEAEVAVTVEDRWQHRGIGSTLLPRLSTLAVSRDIDSFVGSILPENRAALAFVSRLAPHASVFWSDGAYRVLVPLRRDPAAQLAALGRG